MSINTIFMIIIAIFTVVVFATFWWWVSGLCKQAGDYCDKIDLSGTKIPNLIPNEKLCFIVKPHIQKIAGVWVVSESKGCYENGHATGYTIEQAWGFWKTLKEIQSKNPTYMWGKKL